MDNKFLCIIAGYDDKTEQLLADLQNNLYAHGFIGEHTKNLPQHITLGTFEITKEVEMINLVKEVASNTKSFSISFNHVGVFGGSKVLFIAPDPNKALLDLKENFGESFSWTPHTTMLIDQPEIIYEALPILLEDFRSFVGRVEYLHLYEFWPTRHIGTYKL
jgi:2'-5' RNA ligase